MIMFALMIWSLMHCIVHTYIHRKTKKKLNFEKHKKKLLVASFAFLGLSLEHRGCIHLHMEQKLKMPCKERLSRIQSDTLVNISSSLSIS